MGYTVSGYGVTDRTMIEANFNENSVKMMDKAEVAKVASLSVV